MRRREGGEQEEGSNSSRGDHVRKLPCVTEDRVGKSDEDC